MAELEYKKNQGVKTNFKKVQFRKGDIALRQNVPSDPKLHELYYGILKTVRAYLADLYGDRNYNDKYKQIAELIITSINTNKTEGSKPEAISSAIDSADVKLNDDTKKSLVDALSEQIGKSLSADSSKVSSKLDEFFKHDDSKTAQQKAAQEKTDKKFDSVSKRLEMLDQSQSVMDKVMSGISGTVSTMMGLVGSIMSVVGTVLSTVGSIVTSVASVGLSLIMLPIKIVSGVLLGIGRVLFKTIGIILKPLWNFIKNIGSIIWSVVSKPFKMIGSLISDGFSFMKTALKKIATTGLKTFLLSPFGMFAMGYIAGFVYKRFIEPLIDWFKSTRVYKAFAGLFTGKYNFTKACKVFLFGEKYKEVEWGDIFKEKWENLKNKIKEIIYPVIGFDPNKTFWQNMKECIIYGLNELWKLEIPDTNEGKIHKVVSIVNKVAKDCLSFVKGCLQKYQVGIPEFLNIDIPKVEEGKNVTLGALLTTIALITGVTGPISACSSAVSVIIGTLHLILSGINLIGSFIIGSGWKVLKWGMKRVAKKVIKPAAKQATKQATKQVAKQATKQATKQVAKQAAKQATKQAFKWGAKKALVTGAKYAAETLNVIGGAPFLLASEIGQGMVDQHDLINQYAQLASIEERQKFREENALLLWGDTIQSILDSIDRKKQQGDDIFIDYSRRMKRLDNLMYHHINTSTGKVDYTRTKQDLMILRSDEFKNIFATKLKDNVKTIDDIESQRNGLDQIMKYYQSLGFNVDFMSTFKQMIDDKESKIVKEQKAELAQIIAKRKSEATILEDQLDMFDDTLKSIKEDIIQQYNADKWYKKHSKEVSESAELQRKHQKVLDKIAKLIEEGKKTEKERDAVALLLDERDGSRLYQGAQRYNFEGYSHLIK